jgi:hypothetical protein
MDNVQNCDSYMDRFSFQTTRFNCVFAQGVFMSYISNKHIVSLFLRFDERIAGL